MRIGISIREIEDSEVKGYELVPVNENRKGVVLVFGGSEGSCWLNMAVKICSQGYHVFALYYFGQAGLSPSLRNIHLEFFSSVLEYISDVVKEKPLTIVAASRGAELALLLTRYYVEIDNLVLYAPSSHVFTGVNGAAWYFKQASLPFISFSRKNRIKAFFYKKTPLCERFSDELLHNRNREKAFINISDFKGKLLLFAGKDDLVWPSSYMAHQIKENAENSQEVHLYTFKAAGHTFSNAYYDGGSWDGNIYAELKSWEILAGLLNEWHQ